MSYNTHYSPFTKYGFCTVSFLAGVHQAVHKFVRRILALPYLPLDAIPTAFERLRRRVSNEQLVQLMDYVDSTWMKSSIWPPSSWCTYNVAVRTNNDVEGWHRDLNAQAISGELQFYLLVMLWCHCSTDRQLYYQYKSSWWQRANWHVRGWFILCILLK